VSGGTYLHRWYSLHYGPWVIVLLIFYAIYCTLQPGALEDIFASPDFAFTICLPFVCRFSSWVDLPRKRTELNKIIVKITKHHMYSSSKQFSSDMSIRKLVI